MKTIDIALVRLLQALVLLFFTFIVFLWYGCAALIPLALWLNLTEFFHGAFGPVLAALGSLVLVGAFGFYLVKIPLLIDAFLGTGTDLIRLANTNVKRMGAIAEALKSDNVPQEKDVEIVLKDKLS